MKNLGKQLFFRFYNNTVALPLHHRYRFHYINEPDTIKGTEPLKSHGFFRF
jgi:hypothetical protein